jgi:hypothetical protein
VDRRLLRPVVHEAGVAPEDAGLRGNCSPFRWLPSFGEYRAPRLQIAGESSNATQGRKRASPAKRTRPCVTEEAHCVTKEARLRIWAVHTV